jgi:hypothetical protein
MAKGKKDGATAISEEVRPVFEEIAGLVETFCRERLNDKFAMLCRKLTEKLARLQEMAREIDNQHRNRHRGNGASGATTP